MFATLPRVYRPRFIPRFDHDVFQKIRPISSNKAVHVRTRIRVAESGSQFIPVFPCSPTSTGFPNCFHLAASSWTRRSESLSLSDSYQCGVLTPLSFRKAFSQLIDTGLRSGSTDRTYAAISAVHLSDAFRSFRSCQKSV